MPEQAERLSGATEAQRRSSGVGVFRSRTPAIGNQVAIRFEMVLALSCGSGRANATRPSAKHNGDKANVPWGASSLSALAADRSADHENDRPIDLSEGWSQAITTLCNTNGSFPEIRADHLGRLPPSWLVNTT